MPPIDPPPPHDEWRSQIYRLHDLAAGRVLRTCLAGAAVSTLAGTGGGVMLAWSLAGAPASAAVAGATLICSGVAAALSALVSLYLLRGGLEERARIATLIGLDRALEGGPHDWEDNRAALRHGSGTLVDLRKGSVW